MVPSSALQGHDDDDGAHDDNDADDDDGGDGDDYDVDDADDPDDTCGDDDDADDPDDTYYGDDDAQGIACWSTTSWTSCLSLFAIQPFCVLQSKS